MLLLFMGCLNLTDNTVWLVELSSNVTGDCSNSLDHNFFTEESSDGGGDYTSDWTYDNNLSCT